MFVDSASEGHKEEVDEEDISVLGELAWVWLLLIAWVFVFVFLLALVFANNRRMEQLVDDQRSGGNDAWDIQRSIQ